MRRTNPNRAQKSAFTSGGARDTSTATVEDHSQHAKRAHSLARSRVRGLLADANNGPVVRRANKLNAGSF